MPTVWEKKTKQKPKKTPTINGKNDSMQEPSTCMSEAAAGI